MACDNCKDLTGFFCPICAPTTPAKPAVCEVCKDPTCPCGKVVMRTDAELIDALRACRWILSQRALAAEKKAEIDADRANIYRDKMQAAKDECRTLEGRALAAEKQLATLAESGTGYSQQTVDAIVMERDALRGIVARVRRELGDRCHLGCTDRFCVTVTRLHDILDDKETP